MNYSIENNWVKVSVKSKGAELSSYFNKQNQTEYIWQADPKFWGKHTPMLFPVIGMVFNNTITVEGKKYPMVKHGFARDMEFEFRNQSADSLEFALVSSAQTKLSFPFEFELLVKYELNGAVLSTNFIVKNKNKSTMFFSIGGHPAFNCPIEKGDVLENCFIEFASEERDDKVLINSDGFRNGKVVKDYLNGKTIQLTNDIFKDDALIFLNVKSQELAIKSKSNKKSLKFSHRGFPHLGIWAPVGAPFVCLEPWHGVCDSVGYTGELNDPSNSYI
ncbi:MAG: aldose 1-epimerase family protein [Bacteroidetes bacterium]|nr:aldose 1-epimerase family protein [Bacteroidota bacterium]